MLSRVPVPREVLFSTFKNAEGEVLDEGLALFFKSPHSFTGEDVLELQGHGGPVVLNRLLQTILTLGVRVAEPGEFSLRAFLNQKMDLVQAEAVADLIEASSERAAKLAMSSLQGAFSDKIHALVEALIRLRMYVEAAIDFPEEEIDFLEEGRVSTQVSELLSRLCDILSAAEQGVRIKEGLKLVILGKPNAGKSSLLNALAGEERAIVTDIAGTTRDVLREHIHLDGVPLHILDTAGLRESTDVVESEGIRRALKAANEADRLLVVLDATDVCAKKELMTTYHALFDSGIPITWVINKADLLSIRPSQKFAFEEKEPESTKPKTGMNTAVSEDLSPALTPILSAAVEFPKGSDGILISAKTGEGLGELKQHLLSAIGIDNHQEGQFLARTRHLNALNQAKVHLEEGLNRILHERAGELLAEELKQAQDALGQITGEFKADDLLGVIFSSFCIGK
jgi:tRNA modification GTPase